MKKIILGILACVMTLCLIACSCSKEEKKIEYNDDLGIAEGTVSLSGDDPKISITNIKAEKGTIIDYLSNVIIEDENEFEDLRVWVDESGVDIYEPGDYKAKYTFEYSDKKIVHEIVVTIVDSGSEESAGDKVPTQNAPIDVGDVGGNNQNSNNGGQSQSVENNGGDSQVPDQNVTKPSVGNTETSTTKPSGGGNTETSTTKPSGGGNTETSTTKPSGGGNVQPTTKPTETESTRKELITSSGGATIKQEDIGYSYIELLSGSTVSIKSTTTRYIVSTRTDVSYITKKGIEYKVSKLIIRYNTGEERTLETVEEKCN